MWPSEVRARIQTKEESNYSRHESESAEKVNLTDLGKPVIMFNRWKVEDDIDGYEGKETYRNLAKKRPKGSD